MQQRRAAIGLRRLLLWASSIGEVWLLLGLRAGAGVRERGVRSRECLLEGEAGAGVHHRRAPGVDGRDDLLGVDPLQVGAGGGQVRVAELALDQRQRDPLVQELDGVRVAQLVGREPAPDSGLEREVAQLDPCRAG